MSRRWLAALVPLLAACALERPPEKKAINCYLAEPADLASVRRVMVLPFTNEPGVDGDLDRIRTAFVGELAKLRRFEIVPLPETADEAQALNRTLRSGRLSTDVVVALCQRFHLDGVLLASVTAWRAYLPPHLGLRTQLVSVHSGATVWAVDAMFDCNDRSTILDLRHYHDGVQATDATLHGWELNTISPSRFAVYVAHRVAGTWVED